MSIEDVLREVPADSRWTILRPTQKVNRRQYVMARCACGTEREVLVYSILNGSSRSCGCLQRERAAARMTRHGQSGTPEYKRRWAEANRESRRERSQQAYEADRENQLARSRQYHQENPHASWESDYRKRATRFGFTPIVEQFTRDDVVSHYGDRCAWCATKPWTDLDHVVAVRDGGPHTLANVRPSCKACNQKRAGEAAAARRTHCKHGHEFTPENTVNRADGARACRECLRRRYSEYRRRKAQQREVGA